MLKIASYKFYFLGGIVIALAIIIGGDIPNFILRLWILSLIFCVFSLIYYTKHLSYKFDIENNEIYVGERARIKYKLINVGSLIPASNIVFTNERDEKLKEADFSENIYISANDYYEVKRDFIPHRRGFYKIGQSKIKTQDVLGLFEIERFFSQKENLTVYPSFKSINEFDIPTSDLFGEQTILSLISEDYISIKKIRTYVQGDPLKKINQRITAKMGEIYVNEFDSSSRPKLILLADANEISYKQDHEHIIEDKLVESIASISHFALMNKIEVLYIDSSNKHPYFSARDMSSFMPLLNLLTGFEASGNVPLEKFLLSEAISLSYKSSIVLFTPELDNNKCRVISTLKKRGFSIMPIIFSSSPIQDQYKNLLSKDKINSVSIYPN